MPNDVATRPLPNTKMQHCKANTNIYLLICFVHYIQKATNFCNLPRVAVLLRLASAAGREGKAGAILLPHKPVPMSFIGAVGLEEVIPFLEIINKSNL